MTSLYEAAGGEDGLLRLAHAWHERVMADEVVSHAFNHGFHPDHTERLAAYWVEALGGPTAYSDTYDDETAVVRIHSGNGPHEEMDRRGTTPVTPHSPMGRHKAAGREVAVEIQAVTPFCIRIRR